ncbi:MAG: response regulator transcription factor [Pseudomonadota bacterium]
MVDADSSFSRLVAAWMPGSIDIRTRQHLEAAAQARFAAHPGSPVAAADSLGEHPAADMRVLLARAAQRAALRFALGPLASAAHAGRFYRIDSVLVHDLHTLEQHCHTLSPRLVLVDTTLAHHAGATALQQLRWRLPATDWLLFGETQTRDEAELAVLGQMRGCIAADVSTEHLARALDAVASGKLWFARSVLESLYLSLLKAGAPVLGHQPAAVGASGLTAREVEVLALMRHGLTNRQIAERLCISANTVKKHIASVFEKRRLHHRRQELA